MILLLFTQFYIQLVYRATLPFRLRGKTWVLDSFEPKMYTYKPKLIFSPFYVKLDSFLSADATKYKNSNLKKSLLMKLWKKSLSKIEYVLASRKVKFMFLIVAYWKTVYKIGLFQTVFLFPKNSNRKWITLAKTEIIYP